MQKMICFDFGLAGFFFFLFFPRQLLYQISLLLKDEKKCISLKSEGIVPLKLEMEGSLGAGLKSQQHNFANGKISLHNFQSTFRCHQLPDDAMQNLVHWKVQST